MEELEGSGWFWMPGEAHRKYPGSLTFTGDDGGRVEVQGLLGSNEDHRPIMKHDGQIRRVLGVVNNKKVILEEATVTRSSMTNGAVRLSFNLMYQGEHIEHQEDLDFAGATVAFKGMPWWVQIGNPHWGDWSVSQDPTIGEKFSIEIEAPPFSEVPITGGTLSLHHGWGTAADDFNGQESLKAEPKLRSRYSYPKSLHEVLSAARALQDLMTIAFGKTCQVSSLSVLVADPQLSHYSDDTPGEKFERLEVTMKGRLGLSQNLRFASRDDFPQFFLESVGGLPGLARWTAVTEGLARPVALIMSLRHDRTTNLENRLQNAAGAVEAYHRQHSEFSNTRRPQAEYKQLKRELAGLLPREHRSWFHDQVQYGNEPRLLHRLTEVAEHGGSQVVSIVGGDIDWWARQVRDMRNRLVHGTSDEPEADYERMHFLAESMYYVLVLCLFRDCEFPDALDEEFTSNSVGSFMKQRLKQMREADHRL